MSNKDLLGTRRRLKAKKPKFKRQNTGLKKKLAPGWRKPKGYHSKLRLRKRDHGHYVSPGYKSPAAVKGLSREGLVPVLIANPGQLTQLKKDIHGIIVDGAIGVRKRMAVLEAAIKGGFKVLNFRDAAAHLSQLKGDFEKRVKEKKEKKEKKPKKPQALEEKVVKPEAREEPKPEEQKSEEDKKKEEKLEQDKVLTKRQ